MDEGTRKEIEKVAVRTLRDAGLYEPPVDIEALLAYLSLNREFFDIQNPTFLDSAKHRVRVHGQKLSSLLRKIKLVALLFDDEDRIIVDSGLPELKREFPSFHEATHRILPWHRTYFHGDTAQTVDPDWHEQLEAEANFGASTMMFCGQKFTEHANDCLPCWDTIKLLRKTYKKNYVPTLRRFVEHGPDRAMAMLVSAPLWKEKPADQPERWRHYVPSPQFMAQFGSVTAAELLRLVDENTRQRTGGIVGEFEAFIDDDNGNRRVFKGEAFYNRYYLQTLFVETPVCHSGRIIVP